MLSTWLMEADVIIKILVPVDSKSNLLINYENIGNRIKWLSDNLQN